MIALNQCSTSLSHGDLGRRLWDVDAWPLAEPGFDAGASSGAAVVQDEMNTQMIWNTGIPVAQDAQKVPVPVGRFALSEDLDVVGVERRAARSVVALHVVVGGALHLAQTRRQHRVHALQRRHLLNLVAAQDERVRAWIQLWPDDVVTFLDVQRVRLELEGLG